MPAIEITFRLNVEVVRYISYYFGEDPRKIYDTLFKDTSAEEYEDLLAKLVTDDIETNVLDSEVLKAGIRNVTYGATLVPSGARTPRWKSLISDERLKAIELDRRSAELYKALGDAAHSHEYDRIIELATQLKALTSNE